jgi:hypothetical protein
MLPWVRGFQPLLTTLSCRRRSYGRSICCFAYGPLLISLIAGCGREEAAESAAASVPLEEPSSTSLQSPANEPSLEPIATNAVDQLDLQKILATKDEFGLVAIVDQERTLVRLLITTPTPEISISTNMPLSQVLSEFSEAMNQQSNIPIRFALDQTDPDIGEDLQYLENTNIGPLTINAGSMKISSALAEILSMVKDQELTWLIRNESVVITTVATAELPENLLLRSYDIGPLLRTGVSAESIKTTILSLSAEAVEWTELGGFGAIEIVGAHLIVQQTRPGHQKVFEIVERMKQGLESFDAHRSKRVNGP